MTVTRGQPSGGSEGTRRIRRSVPASFPRAGKETRARLPAQRRTRTRMSSDRLQRLRKEGTDTLSASVTPRLSVDSHGGNGCLSTFFHILFSLPSLFVDFLLTPPPNRAKKLPQAWRTFDEWKIEGRLWIFFQRRFCSRRASVSSSRCSTCAAPWRGCESGWAQGLIRQRLLFLQPLSLQPVDSTTDIP